VIQIITETNDGVPPEQEDLEEWATEFGQTFPVVSDVDDVALRYTERGQLSLPSKTLIGRGAEILIADGDPTEADILAALAD